MCAYYWPNEESYWSDEESNLCAAHWSHEAYEVTQDALDRYSLLCKHPEMLQDSHNQQYARLIESKYRHGRRRWGWHEYLVNYTWHQVSFPCSNEIREEVERKFSEVVDTGQKQTFACSCAHCSFEHHLTVEVLCNCVYLTLHTDPIRHFRAVGFVLPGHFCFLDETHSCLPDITDIVTFFDKVQTAKV